MLIKEYRIPLPLTLEEYSIAQLYMIQVLAIHCCFVCVILCSGIALGKPCSCVVREHSLWVMSPQRGHTD